VIRVLTIGLILYCVIQASLVAAFLIGSPRDIANRPVKHVTAKNIDFKKLLASKVPSVTNAPVKLLVVVPTPRYWLVFSNPNPSTQSWVIETRQKLKDPWTSFAQGSVNSFQEASNQFWPTQTMAFFRVGFK
jgi:hypothetical protein